MGKYIDPFSDFGFKLIFGQEENKDVLIGFLNGLFEGERVITDVQYLDKEQLPGDKKERRMIYDIYCQTEQGEHIIIEMQKLPQKHFKERALLYLARVLDRQSMRGKSGNNYDVNAVYGVFFMNFTEDRMARKLRTDVALADRQSNEHFSDKLRMIFIQLPEFRKREEECETFFERWIYNLKNMNILHSLPWKEEYKEFKRLSEICETANLTPEQRASYERSIKTFLDNNDILEYQLDKGIEKGRADTAKNLKAMGMDYSIIQQATGLSKEEIEKL